MITIDTNVLVRVLVDDPGEAVQVEAARKSVSAAETVFIPTVVQAETVWVLRSGYKLKKQEIITLLEHLSSNLAYHLENEEQFEKAVVLYRQGKADFSDYLILAAARDRDTDVLTFDKRFAQSPNIILIQG